ncbi:P-type cation-transporting ATPase [Lactobacillus helveticus CIRM-BIA 951]|uniref:P-type cation-transporting ATPase n=1 Tax=Lactobacillus helveticus CIRM-BIA 951 TaxID=1226334 RepID=U6F1V1_LACHE|nr:P-type cation-transporting ATPase [Lactobacillus helveticus CIRM-BIA 951]
MARKYYTETIPDVVENLNTAIDTGLSGEEAKKRLAKYGPNSLASKKKKSMFMRLVDQFKDFMIIAAILSGVVAHEWTDAAIIMIVVILNAVLGVIQEARSEAAIDALKQMEMATPSAHVRRDNAIVQIPSTEMVLYYLKQGTLSQPICV